MHSPYDVTQRANLSPKKRLELLLAHSGRCCICEGKISLTQRWIVEHILPLWLGGTNDVQNLAPAHEACAKIKTQKEATGRAKGRRIAEKHFGFRQSKRPMPGSKASGLKRKFNGQVVRRKDD